MSKAETTNALAALLPVVTQYGPVLVKDIADLIHGNPQQQGEADDAYIQRLNTAIDAKLDDAAGKDKIVEAD